MPLLPQTCARCCTPAGGIAPARSATPPPSPRFPAPSGIANQALVPTISNAVAEQIARSHRFALPPPHLQILHQRAAQTLLHWASLHDTCCWALQLRQPQCTDDATYVPMVATSLAVPRSPSLGCMLRLPAVARLDPAALGPCSPQVPGAPAPPDPAVAAGPATPPQAARAFSPVPLFPLSPPSVPNSPAAPSGLPFPDPTPPSALNPVQLAWLQALRTVDPSVAPAQVQRAMQQCCEGLPDGARLMNLEVVAPAPPFTTHPANERLLALHFHLPAQGDAPAALRVRLGSLGMIDRPPGELTQALRQAAALPTPPEPYARGAAKRCEGAGEP